MEAASVALRQTSRLLQALQSGISTRRPLQQRGRVETLVKEHFCPVEGKRIPPPPSRPPLQGHPLRPPPAFVADCFRLCGSSSSSRHPRFSIRTWPGQARAHGTYGTKLSTYIRNKIDLSTVEEAEETSDIDASLGDYVWEDLSQEEQLAVVESIFEDAGAVRTKSGHLFLDCSGFERLCIRVLKFQLAQSEVIEIFRSIDSDGDGYIEAENVLSQLQTGRHRGLLWSLLHVFRMHKVNANYMVPPGYNFSRPTNDPEFNYGSTSTDFYGPFREVRERLDFSYHGNYTRQRQLWQDTVVGSLIIRSEPKPMPWLVYTCGGYGTGKGFSLGWMSEHGIFPLKDMVCIDPDHLKRVMPEWHQYIIQGKDAGSLCHAESAYMEEMVQALAMMNRQNIWIDGSLSNTEWYKGVFQDLKERYPHYRIAIFYIFATEEAARARIEARRRATGRGIPEEAVAPSLKGAKRSVVELTPFVDFVARIDNDGQVPILRSVEVVDRSGSWAAIARRFARQHALPQDFPRALAPLSLRPLPKEATDAMTYLPQKQKVRLDLSKICDNPAVVAPAMARFLKAQLPKEIELTATSACPATEDLEMRRLTAVPAQGDVDFCYVYQYQSADVDDPLRTKEFTKSASYDATTGFPAIVELLKYGGFVYMHTSSTSVFAANCVSKRPGIGMLPFGPRLPVGESPHRALTETGRWHAVTLGRLQAAKRYVFLSPAERLSGEQLGGSHGAFVYELEDGDAWLFPVSPFVEDPTPNRSTSSLNIPFSGW